MLDLMQPLAAGRLCCGFCRKARRDEPGPMARRAGALTYPRSIRKQCVDMAPRSWELIALSLLAGIGFGLALDRGDAIFVAVFGAACAMAIIGGMQRFAIRALPDLCFGIVSGRLGHLDP